MYHILKELDFEAARIFFSMKFQIPALSYPVIAPYNFVNIRIHADIKAFGAQHIDQLIKISIVPVFVLVPVSIRRIFCIVYKRNCCVINRKSIFCRIDHALSCY